MNCLTAFVSNRKSLPKVIAMGGAARFKACYLSAWSNARLTTFVSTTCESPCSQRIGKQVGGRMSPFAWHTCVMLWSL